MIPKDRLIAGAYYVGLCRNATVARWDGEIFHHWRRKWGSDFIEMLPHPADEQAFDAFVPVAQSDGHDVKMIPIEGLDDAGWVV